MKNYIIGFGLLLFFIGLAVFIFIGFDGTTHPNLFTLLISVGVAAVPSLFILCVMEEMKLINGLGNLGLSFLVVFITLGINLSIMPK